MLELYKENSKFYIFSKPNVATSKVDTTTEYTVRRMSVLFTEILERLVEFVVAYLSSDYAQNKDSLCVRLFDLLVSENERSGFTLGERLSILNQLNFLLFDNKQIVRNEAYWKLISEGLVDKD